MKGKTLLSAIAVALVALFAASGALAHESHYQLTLKATPGVAQVGGTVTLNGMLSHPVSTASLVNFGLADTRIKLFTSTSPSCNKQQVKVAETWTDHHGFYSATFVPSSPGQIWVQAMAFVNEQGIDSPCVPLTVTTTPVEPQHDSGSFLCYSVGGALYHAANEAVAESLLAAGYWLPTAVPGAEKDGTNVGSTAPGHAQYHLVCKAPGGAVGNAPSADTYTNPEGDLLSGDLVAGSGSFDGFYPIG
jgi:hypothetical protein